MRKETRGGLDLYGDCRVAHKSLGTIHRELIEAGIITKGGDDDRFFFAVFDYLYSAEKHLIDRVYVSQELPTMQREDPPFGGSEGGLLRWLIDHLR